MIGTTFRKDLKIWLPAAILLLANIAALGAYRLLYAGKVAQRSSALERARSDYTKLVTEREKAVRLAVRAEQNQRRLTRLYGQRFQTQEQRVTSLIAEVKELARRSGLDPATIRYPDLAFEDRGLVKRSIVFGVDGTYVALRLLVNLLEVTDTFVILEEIRPGGRSDADGRLSIDLAISTLFVDDDIDPGQLALSRDTVSDEP